jgi:hypothetical protein
VRLDARHTTGTVSRERVHYPFVLLPQGVHPCADRMSNKAGPRIRNRHAIQDYSMDSVA